MSTKAGQKDAAVAAERIRLAAIRLFRERGYHGTSMRDLATAVQLESASLYYHYPSKHDLLFALFQGIMDDLFDGIRRAIEDVGDIQQRLCAAVRFHVGFHVLRRDEAFISHSELRALNPAQRAVIVEKRDLYQGAWCDLLRAGVANGCFDVSDVPVTANAILMMCSGVSDWFVSNGRLSGDQIVEKYEELVLRMVQRPRERDPRR